MSPPRIFLSVHPSPSIYSRVKQIRFMMNCRKIRANILLDKRFAFIFLTSRYIMFLFVFRTICQNCFTQYLRVYNILVPITTHIRVRVYSYVSSICTFFRSPMNLLMRKFKLKSSTLRLVRISLIILLNTHPCICVPYCT